MKELIGAWLGYYRRCEAYDRAVCTGPMGRDGILPATGHEAGMIGRNARAEMAELRSRFPGAEEADWQRAKRYVLDHYDLQAEYNARLRHEPVDFL